MGIFFGADGVKKVKDIYAGVDGMPRKVTAGYVGAGGAPKKFWPAGSVWNKYTCVVKETEQSYHDVVTKSKETVPTYIKNNETVGGYPYYNVYKGGIINVMGTYTTIRAGESGYVYNHHADSSQNIVIESHVTRVDDTTSEVLVSSLTTELRTETIRDYSLGDFLDTVLVPKGKNPEEDKGFVYVTEFWLTRFGERVTVTVMRDGAGDAYYCYIPA